MIFLFQNDIIFHLSENLRLLLPFFLLFFGIQYFHFSQPFSVPPFFKNRLTGIVFSFLAIYILSLIGLSKLWYSGQSVSAFHFFDDWPEWNYMDKFGHFFTAFHIGDIGVHALAWSGVSRKKSILWGSLAGIFFQTPIELLDGFGQNYGFSWGDIVANFSGYLFLLGQYMWWNEIRILPKFSFHSTQYAVLRPNLLGENAGQQFLKDYNGQTYWFAIDFWKFFKRDKDSEFRPEQLFLMSFGYGSDGMVYGRESENNDHGFFPFQQYYFSPDINLEKIPTKYKILQISLFCVNKLHIIAPALEYNLATGVLWHGWYF